MKCGYCGKNIKAHTRFCTNCGHNIAAWQESEPQSNKGATAAILSLLAIIAIILIGSTCLLLQGITDANAVSDTDFPSYSFDTQGTRTDPALAGKWTCTDRTAVDYDASDYGIDVNILLTMRPDNAFTLSYRMTNAGIQVLDETLDGTYAVQNGTVTFHPKSPDPTSEYFKKHGTAPAFPYSVNEETLTLTYENGQVIVFHRVS